MDFGPSYPTFPMYDTCVRACVRAVRACVRAVCACLRAGVRACGRVGVCRLCCACVRSFIDIHS